MTSSQPIHVLLTGPVHGLERWRAALEASEALAVSVRPLLEVVSLALPPLVHRPDWLVVTSANVAPALTLRWGELAGIPAAAVGERSAALLRERGLEVALGPTETAAELFALLRPALRPAQRVLWPRGSLSDDLGRRLRSLGALVDDPIVYDTREHRDRRALPHADYVFLASPSAVRAFMRLERVDPTPPVAVAIGPTTAAALEGPQALDPPPFARVEVLDAPEPEALTRLLVDLERRRLRGG